MRLLHVFAPPGFMSESLGNRGTGGNSTASARFHGHKTNGALGERKPQHAVRKPHRPRRSFAPCRKSTHPIHYSNPHDSNPAGSSKFIGVLCSFTLFLLSSPVKQEKPEPPSLPLWLPLPGQPLGLGKFTKGHGFLQIVLELSSEIIILLCRQGVPPIGLNIILRHALAPGVHEPQVELG